MSEKRLKMVLMLIAVGCAGVFGMELAYMMVLLILNGISEELVEFMQVFFGTFFWSILWAVIAFAILRKKDVRNLEYKVRKKIIINQIYTIYTFIMLLAMLLIIFIMKKNMDGIIFSIAFIIAFLIWEGGCVLANRSLDKEIEENKSKSKSKSKK